MRRLTVYYSGRVQGVGFRARTQRLAAGFRVTGRVCNMTDGRVELIAEGEQEELDRFRVGIADEMKRNIVDEQVTWSAALRTWAEFAVGADK
ncbi:MAG: acylphosphatase [Pirellulales bacterium]